MTSKYSSLVLFDDIPQESSEGKKYNILPFPEDVQPQEQTPQEKEEGFLANAFRTGIQVPLGIASTTVPGLAAGAWQMMGVEAFDPEEIEHIRAVSEREGIPFDEEAYLEAAGQALRSVPTVSNIASYIESETGLPLEPKTRLQKGVRFVTEASRLAPEMGTFIGMGTKLPKPILGAGVEATKELLVEAGVPEPLAEIASFAVLKQSPEGAGSISVGPKKGPSGLTERRFEKLKKPIEVSGKKLGKINEAVESEFRNIASDIIEKSPIQETYSALKNSPAFKEQVRESFSTVENLAEQLPEKISTGDVTKSFAERVKKEKSGGFLPSEYTKSKDKFTKQLIKETYKGEIFAADLVKQFRQNNKILGELYEPGQSFGYNRGKRDAYLDYNRAISDVIKNKFPDSEFANLFDSTNEQWSKIMDAEAISNFMDQLFDGKIKFSVGKDFFEKNGMTVPFERALGKEGFKDFSQLMKDLMPKEKAFKMMRVAEEQGFTGLAHDAALYAIAPDATLLTAKKGFDISRIGYKKIWESLLDKPQLAVHWDKGIKSFKKGDFKSAQKEFNLLNKEFFPDES